MKHLLTLLLATLCAATSYGQTIKSLGYNSANGQIVAATNVVWTNAFSFSTNTVAAQVRTNLGLGATNEVTFGTVRPSAIVWTGGEEVTSSGWASGEYSRSFNFETGLFSGDWSFDTAIGFSETNTAAATRTNLGLPLNSLTNTSNVTLMRALSGSTNTNHPFSGSVALTNTNVLVFSNGILQSVQ